MPRLLHPPLIVFILTGLAASAGADHALRFSAREPMTLIV
jgi:hypothetical protein